MDHLAFFSSALEKSVRAPSVDFYTTPFDGRPAAAGPVTAGLTLSDASLRDAGLLGATVRFVLRPSFSIDPAYDSVSVASARRIADSISTLKVPARPLMHFVRAIKGLGNIGGVSTEAAAHMIRPDVQLVIRCLAETAPDRENRVTLSEKHDALGQQRPSVRWQAGDLEKRSISELHNTLADEIARCGIGRVRPINSDFYPSLQTGASHHIGTTRMHDSPRSGVVDRDCRVHGTANLYIAGSSVFPTSGYANPTLTIIALALRLADRLKGVLNR